MFGGTLRSDLMCSACGHVSTSHEQFSHLSLDIPQPQQVGVDGDAGNAEGIAEDDIYNRIMEAADVAELVWCATRLSNQATLEQVVMRPQLGDL